MIQIQISKPESRELWMWFPDIHFPEHDEEALEVAKAAHRLLKPEYTGFLGDVLDCEVFSAHRRKLIQEYQARDYAELEIKPCNKLMDQVAKNTRFTYYLEGNHEQRIERWATNNGKVGVSIYPLISPYQTIAKGRKNFKMIPFEIPSGNRRGYVQVVKPTKKMLTGGLVAVHGWSFAKHAAYVHLEKSRSQSVLFGHCHRAQTIVTRDPWSGHLIKSFCPGTLSKLQPLYAHGGAPTDWSHGFTLIEVVDDSWNEYNISIVKGRCILPNGKEVKII